MYRLDEWSRSGLPHGQNSDERWYGDRTGLRLSGLMGLGTELFILMLFSLINRLDIYLIVNLVAIESSLGNVGGVSQVGIAEECRKLLKPATLAPSILCRGNPSRPLASTERCSSVQIPKSVPQVLEGRAFFASMSALRSSRRAGAHRGRSRAGSRALTRCVRHR